MPPPVLPRCTLLALSALLILGCNANVPPRFGAGDDLAAENGGKGFSADRAWAHLEALAAIGPRAVGTEGNEAARAYVKRQLLDLGLPVELRPSQIAFDTEGIPPLDMVNLEAEIPGESSDVIVLAAPFDSAYRESFTYLGVNDGASGAALLLELARVIAADPLPYTIRLLFLDSEAPLGRGTAEDIETRYLGSTAAASRMQTEHQFDAVRLLLLINRVSDADLRIARDRFSQRTYRDVIWKTAADLGYADVFAPGDSFDAPPAGHRSFIAHGMRRVVAIVDPRLGDDALPEAGEFTEDDTLERSSPRSLEIVGEVLLASLEAICDRLVKIDHFSEVPVPEELPVAPEPAEENAAEPAEEPGEALGATTDEAPSGEPTAQPDGETAQESAEQPAEKPAEEPAGEPAKETAGEPTP
jgi:hypothetical protein